LTKCKRQGRATSRVSRPDELVEDGVNGSEKKSLSLGRREQHLRLGFGSKREFGSGQCKHSSFSIGDGERSIASAKPFVQPHFHLGFLRQTPELLLRTGDGDEGELLLDEAAIDGRTWNRHPIVLELVLDEANETSEVEFGGASIADIETVQLDRIVEIVASALAFNAELGIDCIRVRLRSFGGTFRELPRFVHSKRDSGRRSLRKRRFGSILIVLSSRYN
jgi:hypothetical protein